MEKMRISCDMKTNENGFLEPNSEPSHGWLFQQQASVVQKCPFHAAAFEEMQREHCQKLWCLCSLTACNRFSLKSPKPFLFRIHTSS